MKPTCLGCQNSLVRLPNPSNICWLKTVQSAPESKPACFGCYWKKSRALRNLHRWFWFIILVWKNPELKSSIVPCIECNYVYTMESHPGRKSLKGNIWLGPNKKMGLPTVSVISAWFITRMFWTKLFLAMISLLIFGRSCLVLKFRPLVPLQKTQRYSQAHAQAFGLRHVAM